MLIILFLLFFSNSYVSTHAHDVTYSQPTSLLIATLRSYVIFSFLQMFYFLIFLIILLFVLILSKYLYLNYIVRFCKGTNYYHICEIIKTALPVGTYNIF